jgi:SAM-dependent methyltransferase
MSTEPARADVWANGALYESYVGRWSRLVAAQFLRRLDPPTGRAWLDVGCGTGVLSQAILRYAEPAEVVGVDPSEGFLAFARGSVVSGTGPTAGAATEAVIRFTQGSATDLHFDDGRFDITVSGLVLNFVPAPDRAVVEMARVTRSGGTIAAYVWDYEEGMQLMRHFWDAAIELDPAVAQIGEARRFPLCRPPALHALFSDGGLSDVDVEPIDVPTVFADFDDYWTPFLGGQGPAPGYALSLGEDDRAALRDRIRARLPVGPDGSIRLVARAWAVRATR